MMDYAGCAARGLTQAQTARELGVSSCAVSKAARRLGLTFAADPRGTCNGKDGRRGPHSEAHKAAISRGLRAAWKRHDFAGKRRLSVQLTVGEHIAYLTYQRAGYRRAEALRAIGREDLVP